MVNNLLEIDPIMERPHILEPFSSLSVNDYVLQHVELDDTG